VTNLDETEQARRKAAADLFNQAWQLIELPERRTGGCW
jgi:hypothetical protein